MSPICAPRVSKVASGPCGCLLVVLSALPWTATACSPGSSSGSADGGTGGRAGGGGPGAGGAITSGGSSGSGAAPSLGDGGTPSGGATAGAGAGGSGAIGGAAGTSGSASGGAAGSAGPISTDGRIDTVIFGDSASEAAHALTQTSTKVIAGALGQPARQCLPLTPNAVNGGDLTFTMKVDPVRRNHVTVKFWGDDGLDLGRLYLYVVTASGSSQVGYRHEGDHLPVNVGPSKAVLPGRFFYSTSLLPLPMTLGKTSLTLRIVSTGRIYPLGTGVAPAGNYQYLMTAAGRGIYRAYSHTEAMLVPAGETQGIAPVATIRATPTEAVLAPGGSFFTAVNNRANGRLAATVDAATFTTEDALYLARAYSVTGLTAYHNSAVPARVTAIIDAFARDYYANGSAAVSGGGNEGWGGRYGNLGWAIHLLLPQLAPDLDATVSYGGTGGTKTRRAAWGDLLLASREFGRTSRDSRYITNQSMLANVSIFMANQGLLDLGNASAFTAAAATRYLREAAGMTPWLGSDLAAGGNSNKYGTKYLQVTRKGLTREWGYVGISYGEMQWHVANFFAWTGDVAFRDQAVKMLKARSYFRRPAIQLDGTGTAYRGMEGIGLLAWRGAGESDGNFADELAYGDRTGGAHGLRVAAATKDPTAIAYAKQMLSDNQYFATLANALFAEASVLEVFADYETVKTAADNGLRLPMTEGQPDSAWADEEDGIIAVKHGEDRLWIAPYFQAKGGTGINGIARFHYSTATWDQYGVVETNPQFRYAATFVRTNNIDKPEANLYVPPDNPTQAYAGERLPLAATDLLPALPANANDVNYQPFRGKANFYALRFGPYVIGLNMSETIPATLRMPPGVTSAPDLISSAARTADVAVAPLSTVVLYAPSAASRPPVPTAPLLLEAAPNAVGQIGLTWSAASGAATYIVKRSATAGGAAIAVGAAVPGTTYTDSGLTGGVAYFYRVSAVNASGASYESMEATAIAPR